MKHGNESGLHHKNAAASLASAALVKQGRNGGSRMDFLARDPLFAPQQKKPKRMIRVTTTLRKLPDFLQTNGARADIAAQLASIMFSHQRNAASKWPSAALFACPAAMVQFRPASGSTTFFYPLELIMSNPTQSGAALQPAPVQPKTVSAPGDQADAVSDEVAAARLTALRIRGQHADIEGDVASQ